MDRWLATERGVHPVVAILFGIVFAGWLVAQHVTRTQLGHRFDALMEDLPGIGSIYTTSSG